jgi:hypothetical protein
MYEHPASEALRQRSSELLHRTLVSNLCEGEKEWLRDSRDLMLALAPYHDCAQRLDLNVADTFRRAADAGPASLRDVVCGFGERDDVTPQAFGYELVDGPRGPSYRLT